MVAVIQRVESASVAVEGTVFSSIQSGLLLLVGVTESDTPEDSRWLAQKAVHMRLFPDADLKINLCLQDVNGEILVISQFTLMASTKKGNRPSFLVAARPAVAEILYNQFIADLSTLGASVKTGKFGAMMKVSLINDGPFTIIVDTKNKK